MAVQLVLFFIIMLLSTNSKKNKYRKEQLKLWIFVFMTYVIMTIVSHEYVNNPFVDYFINPDQCGFYTRGLSLYLMPINDIFRISFSSFEYSDLPLISAYFSILMKWAHSMDVLDLLLFVKLNTAFLGSMIAVVIYKIVRLYDNRSNIVFSIFLFVVVSPLMFLSSQMMRDIHICLIYTLIVYYLLKPKQFMRWIIVFVLIISVYYLRVENGLFALMFIGVYIYRKYREVQISRKVLIICVTMIGVIAVAGIVYETMSYSLSSYTKRSIEYASAGSLGVKLNTFPFPLNYLSKFAFGQLLPFPLWQPLEQNEPYVALRIFECIFPFYWLPILFCLFHSLFRAYSKLDYFLIAFLIVAFMYIFVSSISEFNTRRIMAVYPIIFSIFMIWKRQVIFPKLKMNYASFALIIGLHIVYVIIK